MMFDLEAMDIKVHSAIAASMETDTLQSVLQSITSEHEELSKSMSEKDLKNHKILIGIYADELLIRYDNDDEKSSKYLH